MNKLLVALVLFALHCCVTLPSFSQDVADNQALAELLRINAETVAKWDKGFIDARVDFGIQSADVTAFWDGDRSRRTEKDVVPTRDSTPSEMVYNPDRFCKLSHFLLVAECDTMPIGGVYDIPLRSRILPAEAWNHIGTGLSVPAWLNHEFPKTKVVVRTRDGLDVYLGKKEHVLEVISTAADGNLALELPEGECVSKTHFNRHGLLVSNQYYGTLPTACFLIDNVWSDDPIPMPKVLSTLTRKLPAKEYKVMFRITANKVGVALPKDAPSLAVPPTDVPFGWKLVNNIGDAQVESFVGGEEGKQHWDRKRFARTLVRDFRAN